jgi:uncharacterized protein YbaR (Trm112 family)
MSTAWIDEFLPLFQCPDTHQPLRWAQEEDLLKHGLLLTEKVLVSEDGTRLFRIDQGIPILLPQDNAAS